jgi:hypothetical protein
MKQKFYKKVVTWNWEGKNRDDVVLTFLSSILLFVFGIFVFISMVNSRRILLIHPILSALCFFIAGIFFDNSFPNLPKREIKYEEIKQ